MKEIITINLSFRMTLDGVYKLTLSLQVYIYIGSLLSYLSLYCVSWLELQVIQRDFQHVTIMLNII